MSNELVGRCWLIDFPTPAMQLVMMKLADCADDDGSNVFPSVAYVSRETILSTRSVSDQLAALRECGLVINKRDVHGNRANRTSVDREINIDLLAAVSDARVRGKPRVPSSHVIAHVEIEVAAGADRVHVPGALAPSVFAEPLTDKQAGRRHVWAIMPRGFDVVVDGSTPAAAAGAFGSTPATDAEVPLQQLQGTPATAADHPCDSCQQPLLDSSLRPSPLTPQGACVGEGLIDNLENQGGWASGWTDEARAAVDQVRSSPVVSHIATAFIDAVCGTLQPLKGADPATYVRQLANHLRAYSPEELAAAAQATIASRNGTLPGIADLLKIVQAAKAQIKTEQAAQSGAVAVASGDPTLVARWPEVVIALRTKLGRDVVTAWFDPIQPQRLAEDVLVLSGPALNARWISQNYEQATLDVCRAVWRDVAKIQFEKHARKAA